MNKAGIGVYGSSAGLIADSHPNRNPNPNPNPNPNHQNLTEIHSYSVLSRDVYGVFSVVEIAVAA